MIKRKSISKEKKEANKQAIERRNEFFLDIWKTKLPHKCENCGKFLGYEPLSYMFDHILEKSKYPELTFERENIWYLCFQCHEKKTMGHTSPLMDMMIKTVKKLFNIL